MAKTNFISSAIKHPGALTRKAQSAGMSINAYAQAHKGDSNQTGRQARFYLGVLKPASAKGRKKAVMNRLKSK